MFSDISGVFSFIGQIRALSFYFPISPEYNAGRVHIYLQTDSLIGGNIYDKYKHLS